MESSVYTPGAGHAPPVLAGRDELTQEWQLMLNAASAVGRVRALDLILTGPRGVGKTAMLTSFGKSAAAQGFEVINLQAARGQASLISSLMQWARVRTDDAGGPWHRARKAFDRIEGISIGVAGLNAGLNTASADRQEPYRDPGTVAQALADLATEVRKDRHGGGVLITVDEMQVARPNDLALLAATLHRLNVDHPQAVVIFAGSGLPHTSETLRKAGVTHPDRLFAEEHIPLTLSKEDAAYAVVAPAQHEGVTWHPQAVDAVVSASNGYPAHLQLMAHTIWGEAPGPDRIEPADAQRALPLAAAQIARRTLGPRWDRMPDRQREYMAALATAGGNATARELEVILGRAQKQSSRVRETLIEEGDIYAPRRGHVHMTVPLFARYILTEYETGRLESSEADILLSIDQMRQAASNANHSVESHTIGPT